MSAATTTACTRPTPRGVDRITLVIGLRLVDWSRSRAARRALAETPTAAGRGARHRQSVDVERLRAARLELDSLRMTHFR